MDQTRPSTLHRFNLHVVLVASLGFGAVEGTALLAWPPQHGQQSGMPSPSAGTMMTLPAEIFSFSEADQTLDGGSPLIHLISCRQKSQQQLGPCHGLRSDAWRW